MGKSSLDVLRAASQVLNEKHPDGRCVKILTEYADTNIPGKGTLPPDELATVVALKLMGADGDPAGKSKV